MGYESFDCSRSILWMVSHRSNQTEEYCMAQTWPKAIRGMAQIQIIQNSKQKSEDFGR